MISFVDIETTGLDPLVHEVIEVGIVTTEFREVTGDLEFSLAFDPERADPKALEVNGWGTREFARVFEPLHAAHLLADRLEGGQVCSWHSHFDFAFLGAWYSRMNVRPPWSHRDVLDLPSLALGRLGVCGRGKQVDVMKRLGLTDSKEHNALADAYANFAVFCELGLWELV